MERREKDAKRKAESRRGGRGAGGEMKAEDDPGDLPFPTKEGEPTRPKEAEYPKDFEEFWKAYPRKVDKGAAYKKYMARRKDGWSPHELLTAAESYAAQCRKKKTEKEYIKHPKTFLGDTTPFIEYLPEGMRQGAEKKPEAGNPFTEFEED